MTDRERPEAPGADDEPERVVGTARGQQSGTGGGEVGYGRPPVSGQFARGRSGNPKGRPKGTGKARALTAPPKSLDAIVRTEAWREVTLTDRDGKAVSASMAEVAVKALVLKAGKGSNPAIRTLVQLLATAEDRDPARQMAEILLIGAGLQLKTAAWLFEATSGSAVPDPLPRADEVEIDLVSGEVTLRRPIGRQDQAFWDGCWMIRQELGTEQAILARHLTDPIFCGFRIALEERLSVIDQATSVINCLLVEKWHLTPAELAAPSRHVRSGMTWDHLRDELSPSAWQFFDRQRAALLGQQLLRRSYEVAAGYATAPDAPTPQALRARLLAHPALPERARAALEAT